MGKISNTKSALPQRAAANRKKRKQRLSAIAKAKAGELEAERSVMVDYFDRLPLKQLRAVFRASQIQFPKGKRLPGGELAEVIGGVVG